MFGRQFEEELPATNQTIQEFWTITVDGDSDDDSDSSGESEGEDSRSKKDKRDEGRFFGEFKLNPFLRKTLKIR